MNQADIAKTFSHWLYSKPLSMKAHRTIVRALLLISLLSPLGFQAFCSRISSPSCRIEKYSATHRNHRHIARSSLDDVLAAPAHRSPANRMHRHRGKRINIHTALLLPSVVSPIAAPSPST